MYVRVNEGNCSNLSRMWRTTLGMTTIALGGCASLQGTVVQSESTPRAIASKAIGSPSFAFGSGGDLKLLAVTASGGRNQIRAFVSHDGGDTFKDLGLVTPAASDVTLSGETRPRLVMSRDELLYAVWRDDDPKPRIVVAARDWRRPGFTTPVAVRDIESPRESDFPDMAVAPDDSVYVVWLDGRDYDPKLGDESSVYFAKSTDGGKSFGKNVRVAAHTCPCCRPTIAIDSKGRIYVAWRHDFDDVRDMAVATSIDGGKTFSPLVRVSKDGWVLHGCPNRDRACYQSATGSTLRGLPLGPIVGRASSRLGRTTEAGASRHPSSFQPGCSTPTIRCSLPVSRTAFGRRLKAATLAREPDGLRFGPT